MKSLERLLKVGKLKRAVCLIIAAMLVFSCAVISASAVEIKVQLDIYENAETITLDLDLTTKISTLKSKIAAQTGTPVKNQTLTYDDKTLEDNKTLQDYSITKGKTLVLQRNYTVTFVADGKVIGTQTVAHGNDALLPDIPEKAGHTAVEPVWNNDGRYIIADTTITAVYTSNGYTVTLPTETVGYSISTDKHLVERGSNVIFSFNFDIGYEKGENFAIKVNGATVTLDEGNTFMTKANKNLVVTVEGVVPMTYSITFIADGVIVDSKEYSHGDSVTMPPVPEKPGYTAKWGTTIETATAEVTVHAIYTPIVIEQEDDSSSYWWIWVLSALAVLATGGLVFFIRKKDLEKKALEEAKKKTAKPAKKKPTAKKKK